jgi:predicted transcriptional regulator YdeE
MSALKKALIRFVIKTVAKKNIVSQPTEVKIPGKNFIGYSITTSLRNNKKQEDIPPFYHEVYDNHKLDKLNSSKDLNMYCIFDFHENKQDFDYYVAVENTSSIHADEYAEITIPEGRYIRVELLKRNQKTVGMIVMYMKDIWLKRNGYKERDAQPFILYDKRFHSNYTKYGCKGGNYLGNPIATLYVPV